MIAGDAIRCMRRGQADAGLRYWRIYITEIGDGNAASISGIEFRVDGVNQSTGGVATASSDNGSNFTAANAFDGSFFTEWLTPFTSPPPHWISYEHTDETFVTSVTIRSVDSSSFAAARSPVTFEIQASDDGGASWITELSVTNEPAWASKETREYFL